MLTMRNFSYTLTIAVFSVVPSALAADPSTADPELVQFRQAYTTGSGLAYVIIKDEKGDKLYRYGDASRQAAQKDTRGYMLFTCNLPHVFAVQSPPDKAALLKARVVKAGEPEFAELDVKYLTDCKNPGQICAASDEVAEASLGASPSQLTLASAGTRENTVPMDLDHAKEFRNGKHFRLCKPSWDYQGDARSPYCGLRCTCELARRDPDRQRALLRECIGTDI
jgi:hypothetical protein